MPEKSVNISLTKIFNFPKQTHETQLVFRFYAINSDTLFTRRTVKSVFFHGCLNFVINLKINYTQLENQVIVPQKQIKISIDQMLPEQMKHIGEIVVDLDAVAEKRVKYYPIPSTDQILEIDLYEERKLKTEEEDERKFDSMLYRENFITNRKKFLEGLLEKEAIAKKKFEERIKELVNDCRSTKIKTPRNRKRLSENRAEEAEETQLLKTKSDQGLAKLNHRLVFDMNHTKAPSKPLKNSRIFDQLDHLQDGC